MNHQKFLNLKNIALSADNLFVLCLGTFPIFLLAIKKWMSTSLFLTAIISLYILIRNKKNEISFFPQKKTQKWLHWLSISLASPLFAIILGQLFRHNFNFSSYDSSFRFFLAIPILYTIIHNKVDSFKYLEYAIPMAIFMSLVSFLVKPNDFFSKLGRFSTYFTDPLVFGSISMTLALMSFLLINLYKNDDLFLKLFKLSGCFIGIYLSIISGSRTGWAAIPIVLLLWVYIKFSGKHLLISLISLVLLMKTLFFIPIVEERINIAINEILSYHWSSLNEDTSVGLRISFIRIGFFLFSHNIFSGWGDSGFKELLNAPELSQFATVYAREITLKIGFHNEFVANMVRSGVWGLVSSGLIFLIPFCFFLKGLRSNLPIIRNQSLIAMSYLICVFISGMTNEVFSAKLTASFYSIMMVSLIGSLFVIMSSNQSLEKI